MATVQVFDCTHDNVAHLPAGMAAGYTTGTGTHIQWTAADWAKHPGAVRIDQDPAASDPTADVLDVEAGAASPGDCAGWVKRARADYTAGRRPGQRKPAIYMSRSNVTPVANALIKGGVTSGVGLWIADWNGNQAAATAEVQAASGPFPVIGRQYANRGTYDESVFATAWLKEVSAAPHPPAKPPVPPGQWADGKFWTWAQAFTGGTGLDGKFHLWQLDGEHWVKVI
jgi:hypothetical protein